MFVSKEARIPFIDSRITDFLSCIPPTVRFRPFLKNRSYVILCLYLHHSLTPKKGFSTPYHLWIRDHFDIINDYLYSDRFLSSFGIDHAKLSSFLDQDLTNISIPSKSGSYSIFPFGSITFYLMNLNHLDILRCPFAVPQFGSDLEIHHSRFIVKGKLTCDNCRSTFPISNHIPRFCTSVSHPAGNWLSVEFLRSVRLIIVQILTKVISDSLLKLAYHQDGRRQNRS